ncbi:MAG: acyltransferase family protein, partial [Boseongicola sp.]
MKEPTSTDSLRQPLPRLVYLDWLRIVATLINIPFHALQPFALRVSYVQAPEPSFGFEVASQAIAFWHMPLLFLVAGAGSWMVLSRQSNRTFLAARARRLLVPFLFGILTVLPVAGYLCDKAEYGINHQSFWAYYPTFFRFYVKQIGGYSGSFTPGHLWFLFYLFLFSVIGLYVFRSLEKRSGRRALEKLGAILASNPALVFLAVLPLTAARAVLPFYPSPIYYLCFFFFGYLLFASKPIEAAVRKCLWSAALFVLVLSPVVLHLYTRQTFDDGLLFTMFPFNSIAERLLVELVAF